MRRLVFYFFLFCLLYRCYFFRNGSGRFPLSGTMIFGRLPGTRKASIFYFYFFLFCLLYRCYFFRNGSGRFPLSGTMIFGRLPGTRKASIFYFYFFLFFLFFFFILLTLSL